MDGLEIETVEVTPEANGDVKVTVPEGATPAPVAAAELSFAPGDFQSDLAKLAAEQGVVTQAEKPEAVVTQTAPVVPEPVKAVEPAQPATATVTPVPDKFKNPDGTVNEEKVAKSTQAAEDTIQKYLEKERLMRQTMNSVNALAKGQPLPAPQPQTQPVQINLTPFERQAAIDILNDAQALGIQMSEQQAILQARADIRMAEAKHGAEQSLTASLQERLDLQDRKAELEKIAQDDPFVLSPEGFEALSKIRQDNPWVNQSPTPWAAAHSLYLAQQVKQSRQTGQVLNPTPTAKTAIGQAPKAPPTPVNAVQRAVVKPAEPNFDAMSPDQISAYAAKLGPKAEEAFWAKRGLKL